MKKDSPLQRMHALGATKTLLRAAEAESAGISRTALLRMMNAGMVERVGRGLYRLPESGIHNHPDLVEASVRVPKGVIVLLSALNFHGVGTHPAWEVWMQLPANFPTPKIAYPPLRIIRTRMPEAFTEGVETHQIAGHLVRVTDVDRTIVDCFKHRNKVTLEVCIEALRERLSTHHRSLLSLNHYAKLMGVSRVMQPYMEALV